MERDVEVGGDTRKDGLEKESVLDEGMVVVVVKALPMAGKTARSTAVFFWVVVSFIVVV